MKSTVNAEITDNKDRWLDRWLLEVRTRATGGKVLELGCGEGRDTKELCKSVLTVVAADISSSALGKCKLNVPAASLVLLDLCRPFPFRNGQFNVIIASLCLHYFPWHVTASIRDEIRRCLADNGLFIVRVNSSNDVNYGAVGYKELESGLFDVDGQTKRFFNRSDLHTFFSSGWRIKNMEEMTIDRYERPKSVWETVLIKK